MKKYLYMMACALAFVACAGNNGVAFGDIESKSLIIDKIIVSGKTFMPFQKPITTALRAVIAFLARLV